MTQFSFEYKAPSSTPYEHVQVLVLNERVLPQVEQEGWPGYSSVVVERDRALFGEERGYNIFVGTYTLEGEPTKVE